MGLGHLAGVRNTANVSIARREVGVGAGVGKQNE